ADDTEGDQDREVDAPLAHRVLPQRVQVVRVRAANEARTALSRGYRVVLPYDAHATQNVPAAPGISEEIPAATVSRVAAWALGSDADTTTRSADVSFTAPGPA
ncbi:cysteine hydrolase, partial [Streptomyces sp. NPDC056512]